MTPLQMLHYIYFTLNETDSSEKKGYKLKH